MGKEKSIPSTATKTSVPNRDPSALLTPDEVAEECRVSAYTVREWLKDGRLKGKRLGGGVWRITRRALDEFKGEVDLFGGNDSGRSSD